MHGANAEAFMHDSDDILEAFLRDMSALDHQQRRLPTETRVSVPLLSKPTILVQAPRSTTNKKRRTPSWLKRKRELQALREESGELKTRVKLLKAKREESKASKGIRTAGALEQAKRQKTASDVERQRRHAAQEENASLKKQLQTYVNLSGSLQTALTTIHQMGAAASTLRFATGPGKNLRLATPGVFDMLEKRLDAQFRKLQAAGRLDELHQWMTAIDTDYCKCGDQMKGTVEFKRAQLLPFEQSAVSSVILSIVEGGGFPGSEVSHVVRRSNDAYAMDSRLTVSLDNGKGEITLNGHSVIKRFVTPNGTVLLVESSSDWTADLEHSRSWCHTTEEVGCFTVSNYAVDASHETSAISQLQSTMTLKPREPSTMATPFPLAGARTIIDVVIPSFHEIVKSRHQYVENTLFDLLRGGTSTP